MNNNFNLPNSTDNDLLNGTNIMDLNKDITQNYNNYPVSNLFNNPSNINNPNLINPNSFNIQPQINTPELNNDNHFVKSITRELINNLKENNISLHDDNTTYISNNIKSNETNDYENNIEKIDDFDILENTIKSKNKKSKKNYEYKDDLKKGIEHLMTENGVPVSKNMSSYIFDDLFNLKEFIILFGVYFLLSQEMIKDLFDNYFTSLNPDDSGRVNVKGVIIYGLILTILFMILKKFI
jgi:hypothetical protein